MSSGRNRLKDNSFPYYDNYAAICIRMRVFMANLGYISKDAIIAELESFQYTTVKILKIRIDSHFQLLSIAISLGSTEKSTVVRR